jgi:hypothetical protein
VVNWDSYNEPLVKRGKVLDFDVIDGWYGELDKVNECKKGTLISINFLTNTRKMISLHPQKLP